MKVLKQSFCPALPFCSLTLMPRVRIYMMLHEDGRY